MISSKCIGVHNNNRTEYGEAHEEMVEQVEKSKVTPRCPSCKHLYKRLRLRAQLAKRAELNKLRVYKRQLIELQEMSIDTLSDRERQSVSERILFLESLVSKNILSS